MIYKGYVLITRGKDKGRIGRYLSNDTKGNARVFFGYEGDFLNVLGVSNYGLYKENQLSNDITLENLIERYFDILVQLKAIQRFSHATVKRWSEEHTKLSLESGLVRTLVNSFLDVSRLNQNQKERNIFLSTSFFDTEFVHELVTEFSLMKLNIGLYNHESIYLNVLEKALENCQCFVFVISKENVFLSQMKEEIELLLNKGVPLERIILLELDSLSELMEGVHFKCDRQMDDGIYKVIQYIRGAMEL